METISKRRNFQVKSTKMYSRNTKRFSVFLILTVICKLTNTASLAPLTCATPGQRQRHELNCQQYYECSSQGSPIGSFHLLIKSCPERQAFNVELNRCSRDISDCTLPIQCSVKGGIADPASNSSYYHCEPRLVDEGFRVFHINCGSYELYYPQLGKCFIDVNKIPTQSSPSLNWNQIRDYDIVRAERKLLKAQDKLKLKQQKAQQKAKQQQELQANERRAWSVFYPQRPWL